jgi:hypothetical protein
MERDEQALLGRRDARAPSAPREHLQVDVDRCQAMLRTDLHQSFPQYGESAGET